MTNTSDADVLEWTIADGVLGWDSAEDFFAPDTPLDHKVAPAPISFKQWGVLICAALGVLTGVWLISAWDTLSAHLAVRQTITREMAAELAGDTALLAQLSTTTERVWLEQRLERTANNLPAWLPLPGLRPAPQPPQLQTVTFLNPNLAQAEFTRPFSLPDGTTLTFSLPQFYARTELAEWKRVPTPESYWGEERHLQGQYLALSFYAADAEFAAELLAYVENVLAQTCGAWECPAAEPLKVELGRRYLLSVEIPTLRPDDPLLFALLPPHLTRFPYALLIPSPHEVGYPADEAARTFLKRALATQVLFAAADRFAFGKRSGADVGNAFLYALVARRAVQLGLDEAYTMAVTSVPVSDRMTADRWWNFRTGTWRRPDILRNTVALVNQWLPPHYSNADVELLRQIGAAQSVEEWLQLGLGLSPSQARAWVEASIQP
ncbi:MAG: hypothetical protein JNL09_05990 [Anaerolineales bacterium]|nr:hypothetical protein [Anaerolineales bacterium]